MVKTIRPDTMFIPYHWPGRRSANRLTHRTLDPRSKIPEYKVSACRIEKTHRRPTSMKFGLRKQDGPAHPRTEVAADVRYRILRRPFAVYRL